MSKDELTGLLKEVSSAVVKEQIDAQVKELGLDSLENKFARLSANTSIDELNEIENQAYLTEISFWDEIDRIYKHFDEEIVRLGVVDDYKYIVFQ